MEQTQTGKTEHQLAAKGLRELADWIEKNTALPVPIVVANIWGSSPTDIKRYQRAFGKSAKVTYDFLFCLRRTFGPVVLDANFDRDKVCTRVSLGKRTVEKKIADPSVVVPLITVTEEVEDFEWQCPGSVLAPAVSQ